jgi:two-component system nitrate/nitrite response regulator NarL
MTIRVLLIDDHALFRSGIRLLLERQADIDVVDEAADGLEGIKRAKRHKPDVVLLDLNMPGLSGIETLQLLIQDVPDAAVVILTVSEDAEELVTALRTGASGYLVKNIETETLVAGIRKAAMGASVIAEDMTAKLVDQLRNVAKPLPAGQPLDAGDRLTARERLIVRGIARGESNKELARSLNVAESTVKAHVQNILKKLNFSSRVQMAVYAVERGLHDEDPA